MASSTLTADDYARKGLESTTHFPGLASLCDISAPPRDMFKLGEKRQERPKRAESGSKPERKGKGRRQIPPQKVFDNLYYVGAGNVASWAIDTGKSIVLVDALNNNEQAQQYIVDGLSALGLGNKPISHLIISHGHGDHYGGFELIKSTYNPRIVMSNVEWDFLENDKFASYRWGKKPSRDVGVTDGETLKVNDTELTLYVTPGHTPGTLTVIFPVTDGNEQHRAVLWGGTGLNYGPDVSRIQSYTDSAMTMKRLVKEQNIDVFLSNHPSRAGTREKLEALSNRESNEKHAFVQGQDVVVEAFELLENCTRAQWMRIEEKQHDQRN
ncbi:MBL fold metallo-hydrolase [Alteromonas gracilis]|uniref:MBL fold metallo-hydrolase n=2 Tax=Alteromonas gracilis TaxID=1479524 RepID=A0ABX5CTJ9_9ALTE|nr:MBL fold metallo-hydrolase [Alteromonas gracilis]